MEDPVVDLSLEVGGYVHMIAEGVDNSSFDVGGDSMGFLYGKLVVESQSVP